MFMNPLIDVSDFLFPQFGERTYRTSSSKRKTEAKSSSKSKEGGPSTIDVNISLYDNNIQKLTSVSFFNELPTHSVSRAKQLTATYVKEMEEVISKGLSGSTPTEE